jgi:hypothetical protein
MSEPIDIESAIRRARGEIGFVTAFVAERVGMDLAQELARVEAALGVTQHVGWREIDVETDGRRLLEWAIGHSLSYRDALMSADVARQLTDQVISAVPSPRTAFTNVGRFAKDFSELSYDPLRDWMSSVGVVILGHTLVAAVAIVEDD